MTRTGTWRHSLVREVAGILEREVSVGQGVSMQDDQGDDITDVLDRLHAGGWSVDDTAFHDVENGGQVWVVTGTNGENMIRAEGVTCAEAWRHTLDQKQRRSGCCRVGRG